MANHVFTEDPAMLALDIKKEHVVFHNVKEEPFQIYGLYDPKHQPTFRRMPAETAETVSPGVARLNYCTSGGRIRFRTDSKFVSISCKTNRRGFLPNLTAIASSGFDLYIDYPEVGGRTPKSRFVQPFRPPLDFSGGFSAVTEFPDRRMRYLTINFPMYNYVDDLLIGLEEGAALEAGLPYVNKKPVLYYGSSITQGASASRPGLAYPAIISRRLNCDYRNLGFSGNGKAEDTMIEYLAKQEMSVFVSDYDHNAPSVDYLARTHYKLYSGVRNAQPDLPIILISQPDFHTYTQNGTEKTDESIERRDVIIDTFRRARENGDKRVWYIDGEGFFNGPDEEDCTIDGSHPNDLGMMKMADNIHRVLLRILNEVRAFD